MATKLTAPSVLAFERNLDISDACFSQCNSSNPSAESALTIREKSVRGTISNRLKNTEKDPAKLNASIEKPNLQTVDVAMLDDDKDTLIARFTLKTIPFNGKPSVCNSPDFQTQLMETVAGYLKDNGLKALSQRYAANLANARWLWRNRIGAEKITVIIKNKDKRVEISDAKQLSLNSFDRLPEEIQTVAAWIEQGLLGEAFILLEVEARAVMGNGQEVFPSQELILDTGRSNKSKVLYAAGEQPKAAMHSQKVGNAVRTIDTWYADETAFPIAVEPYGAVTTLGTAFRQPDAKKDFYTLFDNWILKGEAPAIGDQHYVIAVLIRGGVFGASGKE